MAQLYQLRKSVEAKTGCIPLPDEEKFREFVEDQQLFLLHQSVTIQAESQNGVNLNKAR